MARIIHPRPKAGKQTFAGVTFRDGFADVEVLQPEVRAALVLHNFTFEDAEDPAQPKKRSRKGKTTKPAKVAEQATMHADGPFGIVEMPDGTIIGDGESLATIPASPEE